MKSEIACILLKDLYSKRLTLSFIIELRNDLSDNLNFLRKQYEPQNNVSITTSLNSYNFCNADDAFDFDFTLQVINHTDDEGCPSKYVSSIK